MPSDPYIGVDLRLNNGDLGYTPSGDLDLVGNINPTDNVWQSISLRLLTTLGTYNFANNYGTNARQFIEEPETDSLIDDLTKEIKSTVLQDPRVTAILNLSVTIDASNNIIASFGITTVSGTSQSGSVNLGGGS